MFSSTSSLSPSDISFSDHFYHCSINYALHFSCLCQIFELELYVLEDTAILSSGIFLLKAVLAIFLFAVFSVE